MVTIRSYLNNAVSDSISGTEKFSTNICLLFFYYIYFFPSCAFLIFLLRWRFSSFLQTNLATSVQVTEVLSSLSPSIQHLPHFP